ncbi:uncharacterized protein [Palaemon carinicauda]|uniref:uncharacterized protein n=1 Tax=Palaemon carinicauda TaxID=392227 RepID=UPI0035B6923A
MVFTSDFFFGAASVALDGSAAEVNIKYTGMLGGDEQIRFFSLLPNFKVIKDFKVSNDNTAAGKDTGSSPNAGEDLTIVISSTDFPISRCADKEGIEMEFLGVLASANTFRSFYVDNTSSIPRDSEIFTRSKSSYTSLSLVYEYHGGRDAELEKDDDFLVSYLCDFELDYFPFDCHECYIEIDIVNHGSFTSHFHMERFQIDSEESPTTLFYVSKLKLCSVKNETRVSKIVMKFMVSRNAGAFFLTTFLPSMILGIIGCFTHTFDEKDFSDRIMVTLTCLIVIASLFSTTTSVTPNSATPKLVDIFFFFYIARLFMIFIIHSIQGIMYKKRKMVKDGFQKNHEYDNPRLEFEKKWPISYAKKKNLEKSLNREVKLPLRGAWEDDVEVELRTDRSLKVPAMNIDKLGLVLGATIDGIFLLYFSAIIICERYNLFSRFTSDSETCPLTSVY